MLCQAFYSKGDGGVVTSNVSGVPKTISKLMSKVM